MPTNLPHSAIQGIGGGTILNLSDIIISDLVPLAERGIYEGLLGLTWAFASGIGPPIVCFSSLFSQCSVVLFTFVLRGACSPKKHPGDGYFVCLPFTSLFKTHPLLDLNLPLTCIAFILVIFFLRVRTPEGSVREKLSSIDWM
jgi:MFS family permease